MPVNQYLPFATGVGANVLSSASWAAIQARTGGFQPGTAPSIQFNTALRQASVVASAFGQFTADHAGVDVYDDGNVAALAADFALAVASMTTVATFLPDTSSTAGLITVARTPPFVNYYNGLTIEVQLAQTITGPTQLNLNGLGNIPVRSAAGQALVSGDYKAGDVLLLAFNGSAFLVLAPTTTAVVASAVTKTIFGAGADFATLEDAKNWVTQRSIASTGSVVFQLAAGTFQLTQDFVFNHPNRERITFQGAALAANLPDETAFTFTGNSASQRSADTATNLAVLRTYFRTEIVCNGSAKIIFNGGVSLWQDILVSTYLPVLNDQINLAFRGGISSVRRIASVNAGFTGLQVQQAQVLLYERNFLFQNSFFNASVATGAYLRFMPNSLLVTASAGQYGLLASPGGLIGVEDITATGPKMVCRCNGTDGVVAHSGQVIASLNWSSNLNGGVGFVAYNGGVMRAPNTVSTGNVDGYASGNRSFTDATNTSGTNTRYGFNAYQGGWLYRTGSSCTGSTAQSSPAVGSQGSDGGYVY